MAKRVLVPLIIGVTGKRNLQGKDEAVRKTLRWIFSQLDSRFPASPKILLSGLAAGADTIAAEEALNKNWQVCALLPLAVDLYAQDFDVAGAKHLIDLISRPKVRTIVLDPLRDPLTGKPYESAALLRSSKGSNPARSAHYEQVGILIAQHCALLVAVKSEGERADRLGGTARVVDCRLQGQLDARARDVVERSRVLSDSPPLDFPRTGPVWVIDLATVCDAWTDSLPPSLKILMPGQQPLNLTPAIYRRKKRLGASLRLVDQFDRFNGRILHLGEQQWREIENRAGPWTNDAISAVRRIRLALSAIQSGIKNQVRLSVIALAVLFVTAIFFFELHAKFDAQWAIVVYVALIVFALGIYYHARRQGWQPIAEGYRGVAEAFRVQMVWWESGMSGPDHRADRFYLRGAVGSLAHVREALHYLVDATLLTWGAPAPSVGADRSWIDDQITFFKKRSAKRRVSIARVEMVSWFLFLGALGPALWLSIIAVGGPRAKERLLASILPVVRPGVLFAIFAITFCLVAIVIAIVSARWSHTRIGLRKNVWGWSVAVLGGLLLSVGLYDAVSSWNEYGLGLWFTRLGVGHDLSADRIGEHMVAVAAIGLPAVAGAIRFVADKLSLEAELNRYEEALGTFQRARQELDMLEASDFPPSRKAAARTTIVLALGKVALEENDAWIRAHRERPLEPVVGG